MSEATTGNLTYLEAVEEHFRAVRGTGFFNLSPIDWALVEAWQVSGVPIEAVFRGIDQTFENWRKQPARARTHNVNSLAYCAQEIAAAAQAMASLNPITRSVASPPFSIEEVREFVTRNAGELRLAGYEDLATRLDSLNLEALYLDLEELEQQLTGVEGDLLARLHATSGGETLTEAQRAHDLDLKPYREKMSAEQLKVLEKQFLDRRVLESARLPRLSLFYL